MVCLRSEYVDLWSAVTVPATWFPAVGLPWGRLSLAVQFVGVTFAFFRICRRSDFTGEVIAF